LSAEAHQEIRLATRLEAILYLKGQPVPLTEMVTLTNSDRLTVEDAMIELMSDYAHRDSALEVVETPLGYSLQLRSAYQNLIEDLIPAELGTGTLRFTRQYGLSTGSGLGRTRICEKTQAK